MTALCILMLTACSTDAPVESTGGTTPSLCAAALYDAACAKLRDASNLILSYDCRQQRTVGEDTYTEAVTGTDSYCGIGTEHMNAIVRQSLSYGAYQTEYAESFIENTAYSSVNGSCFSSEMDENTFRARQLPAVLLDSTLYGSITAQANGETVLLTFSDASAVEAWAHENAALVDATATALLDENGCLLEYSYEASFTSGSVPYQLSVHCTLTMPQHLDLSAAHPPYTDAPAKIDDLDAPKLLLKAVGDLFTARSISAEITQHLSSGVYSLTQNQQSSLHLVDGGDQLTALRNTTLTATDYRGDPVTTVQSDRYENGTLTRTVGGTVQHQQAQTPQQIRIEWENQILNAFFALDFLANATITDAGNSLTVRLYGNEAFCDAVSASFGSVLPNDLDAIADSYDTSAAGGYLSVQKDTGIPVSMGMEFERTHIIDGVSYPLSYALTQELKLSDAGTADAISSAE